MATTDITFDDFESVIRGNDIVLLDFWAAWCAPCRMFSPIFEAASERNPDVVFGKIDTEAQQELVAGFRITSIPTLMIFREGVIVYSRPGVVQQKQLDALIESVRDLDMDAVRASIAEQQAAAATPQPETAR